MAETQNRVEVAKATLMGCFDDRGLASNRSALNRARDKFSYEHLLSASAELILGGKIEIYTETPTEIVCKRLEL